MDKDNAKDAARVYETHPFRFVFMVRFEQKADMDAYIAFWKEMSTLIQQEHGARGTRLHRVKGERFTVLAIAEWESKDARVRAYEEIMAKYPPDHKIHWQPYRFGGEHVFIVEADEIEKILPSLG
jgi:hypothetical protein